MTEHDHQPIRPIAQSETATGRAVVFLLCAIMMFATILYGAVDSGTTGLLAGLAAVLFVLWCAAAWRARAFQTSTDVLQLPLLGLVLIAFVQLLPLEATRSLDPYATRFFLICLLIYVVFFAAALTFVNDLRRLRTGPALRQTLRQRQCIIGRRCAGDRLSNPGQS